MSIKEIWEILFPKKTEDLDKSRAIFDDVEQWYRDTEAVFHERSDE